MYSHTPAASHPLDGPSSSMMRRTEKTSVRCACDVCGTVGVYVCGSRWRTLDSTVNLLLRIEPEWKWRNNMTKYWINNIKLYFGRTKMVSGSNRSVSAKSRLAQNACSRQKKKKTFAHFRKCYFLGHSHQFIAIYSFHRWWMWCADHIYVRCASTHMLSRLRHKNVFCQRRISSSRNILSLWIINDAMS